MASRPETRDALNAAPVSSEEAPLDSAVFTWPTPDGWNAETIPFPLDFAPTLPYAGVEELRFAPRFFDPTSETYFTYAFAFILEQAPPFSPEQLAADLRTYFIGLASAVTGSPADATAHDAHVEWEPGQPGPSTSAPSRYRGMVKTVDAFGDGRTLDLKLVGETFACRGRRVIVASMSPKDSSDTPTWDTRAAVRQTFSCAAP